MMSSHQNQAWTAEHDPVQAANSALAHGRIGLVAWAIFERGDGLVLSFEKQGRHFTIEVDSASEWAAFHNFRLDAVLACKCGVCATDEEPEP